MKTLLLTILILFIGGCAGSPMAISLKSPEQLKAVPDEQLCDAYASVKSEKLKAELLARNMFTDKEWLAIERHDIYIGMSRLALFASRPNGYDRPQDSPTPILFRPAIHNVPKKNHS